MSSGSGSARLQAGEPAPAPPATARVTLSRVSEADVRERQVLARVDDGHQHTLYFGDQITLDLAPGEHRLRANNTLIWKSVTFRVEPGQHVEFQLVSYASRFAFSLLALVGAGPIWLRIERRDPPAGPDPVPAR